MTQRRAVRCRLPCLLATVVRAVRVALNSSTECLPVWCCHIRAGVRMACISSSLAAAFWVHLNGRPGLHGPA